MLTTLLGIVLAFVLIGLVSGFIIWIVSKLGLGLEVDGFGSAFIAAIVISLVSTAIHWLAGLLFNLPGGWIGIIINVVVAAVILLIGDALLKGLKVAGFVGAVLAAVSMGLISGILVWLVSLI